MNHDRSSPKKMAATASAILLLAAMISRRIFDFHVGKE